MRLALVLLAAASALAACNRGDMPVLYEVGSANVTTPGQITEVPAE